MRDVKSNRIGIYLTIQYFPDFIEKSSFSGKGKKERDISEENSPYLPAEFPHIHTSRIQVGSK